MYHDKYVRIYKYTNNKYYKSSHYKYVVYEVNFFKNNVRTRKAFKTKTQANEFYKTLIT